MSAISLESSLKVSEEVVFRELDGEAVLLNLASGMYFGLDGTGTRIWQLIGEHRQLADVLAALCEEFDAPRDAMERDLLNLASELSEKGLLVPSGS